MSNLDTQTGQLKTLLKQLPPDPDDQNDDRASWALAALLTFKGITGTDDEDAICDLITDLMHLCDREPRFGTVDEAIERARGHYLEETAEFEDEEDEA